MAVSGSIQSSWKLPKSTDYEGTAGPHPNTWHFHLTDWLGTERMQNTAAGNNEEVCYSYPFGDGLTCTGSADATEHHFTSKERDTESGLDYFEARYLSSDLARFMTPDWAAKPTDVPYAQFGDPQSLNLYAYVRNNPNSRLDVDGHVDWDSVVVATTTALGGLVGTYAGADVGAVAGTLVEPGGGTIVGAVAGMGLGGTGGAILGQKLGQAIVKAVDSSSKSSPPPAAAGATSGPKAAGAKCVSCNGQAANPKTGEKLGPSGKEMGHSTDHSTKKSAKEEAGRRSQDGKARNDANPADGRGGHYHPNESDNKGSDHHYYPGKNNP